MDVFEQLEVLCPERTIQQDEEEEACSTAGRQLEPPLMLWNKGLRARLYPSGVHPQFLIIATSKVACALVNHAFSDKQVLFSLLLPEVSMRGNTIQPSLQDRTCIGSAVANGAGIIVSCQYDVSAERANTFSRALLEQVCPDQMIVLGSMRSEQYYGPGDASQDAAVFSLRTSEAPSASVPPLPTGNTLGGLPAALLSHRQVRIEPGTALVVLEMVPSLCTQGLQPLAQAAAQVAQTAGLPGAATALSSMSCVQSARKDLAAVFGQSLDTAVFS